MGTVGDIITHVTFIHLLLQTCQDQSASHIIQISHPMHLLMQVSLLEGVFHSVSPVADDKLVGPGHSIGQPRPGLGQTVTIGLNDEWRARAASAGSASAVRDIYHASCLTRLNDGNEPRPSCQF